MALAGCGKELAGVRTELNACCEDWPPGGYKGPDTRVGAGGLSKRALAGVSARCSVKVAAFDG